MGTDNTLNNRIRERREASGLTQEELGNAIGLTRQSIIAIEKRRFIPSVVTALKLAMKLGYPVDELFWIEDQGQSHD